MSSTPAALLLILALPVSGGEPSFAEPGLTTSHPRSQVTQGKWGQWERLRFQHPPAPGCLQGVAFGNDRYLAVAYQGAQSWIDEHGSWLAVDNRHGWMADVVWTGTSFVAVSYLGYIYYRTPPTGWSRTDPGGWYYSVAFNGSELIAVGVESIATSSDGRSWEQVDARPLGCGGQDLTSVCWAGSSWIAVGYAGFVASSADGHTWVPSRLDTPVHLLAVASNGATTIAVGQQIWRVSQHGKWQLVVADPPNLLEGVTWTGTQWIAVGHAGLIMTSDDGLSWHELPRANGRLYDVAAGPGSIVAVGDATITQWREATGWRDLVAPVPAANGLVWAGGRFLAVSSSQVLESIDGRQWRRLESGFSRESVFLHDVTWSGDRFIAVGERSEPDLSSPVVETSVDGRDWREVDLPGAPGLPEFSSVLYGTYLTRVTATDDRVIAAGRTGVAQTFNGRSWGFVSLADGATDIGCDDQHYVLITSSFAEGQPAMTSRVSQDFDSWSEPFLVLDAERARRLAHHGDTWLALGASGRLAASQDGMLWREQHAQGAAITDVVWAEDAWFAVTADSMLLTSSDGASWDWVEVPWEPLAEPIELVIAAGGRHLVAVGEGVVISGRRQQELTPRRGVGRVR